MKPHISFDITGDGVIGSRELQLGQIFDKDKDGKLNEEEKKQLMEAIAEGYDVKPIDAKIHSKDPAVM